MTENGVWGPQVIWDKHNHPLDDILKNGYLLHKNDYDALDDDLFLDEDDPFGYREHGYHGQD